MKETVKHKSFINPELEVTNKQYAISYVKKNYDSGSSLPEHAFMIIQTPDRVMRAEILKELEKSVISYEVFIYQAKLINSFDDRAQCAWTILYDAFRWAPELNSLLPKESKTLKVDEAVDEAVWRWKIELRACKTDEEIYSLLWELHEKIKKQIPKYTRLTPFQLYATQVFKEGEHTNACRTLVWDPEGKKIAWDPNKKEMIWNTRNNSKTSQLSHRTWLINKEKATVFMRTLHDEQGQFVPYSVLGDTSILNYTRFTTWAYSLLCRVEDRLVHTMVCISMGDRMNKGPYTTPIIKNNQIAHNCATWVVEKLRGLSIPEIEKDLAQAPSFSRIAYVTSFDIGNRREAQGFLTVTMPTVVGLCGSAPSAVSTGGTAGVLAVTAGSAIAAPVAYTAIASSGCTAIEVASCVTGKVVMQKTNWQQKLEHKPDVGRE